MEQFQFILTAIGTVGFPIVCCLLMAWYVKYITDKNREEVAKLNEQHKVEMNEVTTAISNNTIAIIELREFLSRGSDNG